MQAVAEEKERKKREEEEAKRLIEEEKARKMEEMRIQFLEELAQKASNLKKILKSISHDLNMCYYETKQIKLASHVKILTQ